MIHSSTTHPAGGAIYEGVTYCTVLRFLTLGANGKTLKFRFFVIRVYDETLGHILEPLVAKYRTDIFACLRDIAEKRVPANLKPIVGSKNPAARRRQQSGLL